MPVISEVVESSEEEEEVVSQCSLSRDKTPPLPARRISVSVFLIYMVKSECPECVGYPNKTAIHNSVNQSNQTYTVVLVQWLAEVGRGWRLRLEAGQR